jgi:hypothetical protein
MTSKNQAAVQESRVTISAPNFKVAEIKIVGASPYVQLRFSEKVKQQLLADMESAQKKKGKKRDPRNYAEEFKNAMYETKEGWRGMPASAFRKAMVSACRVVGFKMTLAKLSVFIIEDGIDKHDGYPLIKILTGKPEMCQHAVRNATGVVDVRTRAMWREWSAKLKIRYDADQFNESDIANLLARVGEQVGIGEGRPDSRESCGMGWGLFKLA